MYDQIIKVEAGGRLSLEKSYKDLLSETNGILGQLTPNQKDEVKADKIKDLIHKISDMSMFLPATNYDLEELNVTYKVKTLEDQTMHFRNKRYGFVDTKRK